MAGSLKKACLSKLKSLEGYLDSSLPACIPREMKKADLAVASLLTTAASVDASITVLKNGTFVGFDSSGSPLYMTEGARMGSYLISRIGFLPGISLDQLLEVSAFIIVGYGLYKSSKVTFDNNDIPHGGIVSRIPSYAFLLACTYLRAKCASSWL